MPHSVPKRGARHRQGRKRLPGSEKGAALVEFAMVLPLLIVLLFGVIEASWTFAQMNDVRHGAREGARAAAVDVGDLCGVGGIGELVTDRMDIVLPTQNVNVILTPGATNPANPGEGSVGGSAQITVTADLKTLTGLLDPFFGGKTLASTIEFRLEQPATGSGDVSWWAGGAPTKLTDCP